MHRGTEVDGEHAVDGTGTVVHDREVTSQRDPAAVAPWGADAAGV